MKTLNIKCDENRFASPVRLVSLGERLVRLDGIPLFEFVPSHSNPITFGVTKS
jgi:hypothetical protein